MATKFETKWAIMGYNHRW